MRKILLTLVIMLCVGGVEMASAEDSGPAPSAETTQSQMKKNEAKDSSKNSDCSAKQKKQSMEGPQEDAQAPQNTVEYGGGA